MGENKQSNQVDAARQVAQAPVFVATLAFVAGGLNVWALMNAGAFATSQTGNLAASALYLVTGSWGRGLFVAGSVLAFGLGAMMSALVRTAAERRGHFPEPTILVAHAMILTAVAVAWGLEWIPTGIYGAHSVAVVIAFVAGAQGNTFRSIAGHPFSNVAITAELQGVFNNIGVALGRGGGVSEEQGRRWSFRLLGVLAGFSAGALAGAALALLAGWGKGSASGTPVAATGWTLLLPALVTAVLAGILFVEGRKTPGQTTTGAQS